MGVYFRANFEVSSIILKGFRQGGAKFYTNPQPPTHLKTNPLKAHPD